MPLTGGSSTRGLILMVIVSRPRASEYSLIRRAAVTPRGTCSGRGDAPPHPRPVDPGGNKRALKFAGAQRGNVPLMLGNAGRNATSKSNGVIAHGEGIEGDFRGCSPSLCPCL